MKKNLLKRLLLIGAIVIAGLIYRALGLDRYLTLASLKDSLEDLSILYAEHRLPVLLTYFALYVTVTAISIPGAAVLTLGGGALFGFFTGTLIVSFASTIGATLACAAARFLLRDWVQAKLEDKIGKINEGIEREGAFYLFTLRLIPLFPFWMINLVMGLTKIPLLRFYWVSQLGMLAGTMVYVNAGKELAKIDSLQGILSPRLLLSFALLGIFPLAVRKFLGLYRQRRKATSETLS
ncbi:MAG: TVP38/TMEM64 family protein [Deltaproteobacteria bacterium]|nr:TVP38/TMEM64 family protein [Deltaproteobacteria bacterium]